MCGILGYFSKYDIAYSKFFDLKRAASYLKERGPDYLGIIKKKKFFLSNSRLKIVSKTNYDLPLYKHESYISFSGEILNYKELKNFLKKKNYKFFTDTDTEVILSMYDYYGTEFVNYLKGFFSICIYDKKKNLVLLVVDRIGNKSIFYNFSNNSFLFSSQQSYLLKSKLLEFDVNKKKIDEYLVFGDISGDQTLHKNIKKMIPGQIIIYNFDSLKKYFYYELDEKIINKNEEKKLNLNKSIIKVNNLLTDTIDLWQNNCAYEKSILLSGGIDSGLLAMILNGGSKKISSFTANFLGDNNIKKNELDEVKKIIKKFKIQNKLVDFKKENILENLLPTYSNFEEPLPSSCLLLRQLSKFVGNVSKNRICFTGDGADEIFGGYIRHHVIKNQYEKNTNLNTIALGFNYLTVNRLKKYFNKSFKIPEERINFLSKLKNLSTLDIILLNDVKFYLPIFLRSTEIIGMNHSIEYRSPFTDYNLIEQSFSLKDDYRIKETFGKIILKKIFRKYLKKQFYKKQYFSTPFINENFKQGILKEYISELNNNSKISNYFSIERIKRLLRDHKIIDQSNTLMRLLTLEFFLRSH